MIDYKISDSKGFRYIFVKIDIFSKYVWAIPLKMKNSKTVTDAFSNILSTSKQSSLKIESDRGEEFYNSIFHNFLKSKTILQYSKFSDKGPSIAEKIIRTIRKLLKNPLFEKGNAD